MADSQLRASWVLFDVGGTLIRVARPVGETYAWIGAHYGAKWDARQLDEGFRRAFKKLKPRENGTVPSNGDDRAHWRDIMREALAETEIPDSFPFDDFFEEVYTLYTRDDLWRLFPDVLPALEQLQAAGLKLGILSNWDERMEPLLRGLNLRRFFDKVFVSACLGFEKPDPALYRYVTTDLGVSPTDIFMVGDDEMNDYWAPQQAGWHAMLVERPERGLDTILDCLKRVA